MIPVRIRINSVFLLVFSVNSLMMFRIVFIFLGYVFKSVLFYVLCNTYVSFFDEFSFLEYVDVINRYKIKNVEVVCDDDERVFFCICFL